MSTPETIAADAGHKAETPVPGFPGYFATRDGRIFSMRSGIQRKRYATMHELKPVPDATGYLTVGLYRDNRQHNRRVHTIILETFVGPRPPGLVCCHGPGGPLDNSLENLCWGTRSKNNGADRVRDGNIPRGERHGQSKLGEMQVRIIRRLRGGLSPKIVASVFNVTRGTVHNIQSGKSWGWMK